MAMRTAAPWWLSAALVSGLAFLFLGERPFADTSLMRQFCTGLGLLLIFGTTALRGLYFMQSANKRKLVERILLLCHAGVMLGLVVYALTTGWGRDLVGLGKMSAKGLDRYTTALTVLYAIILLVSVIPMFMTELALGVAERSDLVLPWQVSKKADEAEAAVDADRVGHMATSGLTIALATAFLMVTCNVASQRNVRKDVSYFKTSSPGTAVKNMVGGISTKLRVLLMFPEVNEVKEEVKAYFQDLAKATGRVEIEEHDPLVSPALAQKYKARMSQNAKDAKGYIVLIHEKEPASGPDGKAVEKDSTISVSTDMLRARRRDLRRLDSTVHKHLTQVLTEKRTAYFLVGHGEANALPAYLQRKSVVTQLRKTLQNMNYSVKDWSGADGPDVPDDCTILFVLAPQGNISEGELEAIDRYLKNGGSTLIALDPAIVSVYGFRGARGSSSELGALEGRLGVKYDPTPVFDRPIGVMRLGPYRLQVMGTREFSSHASVTGLSRVKGGMPLLGVGSWTDVPFTDESAGKSKRYYVIKSESTSWVEKQLNGRFDKDVEKKQKYNIAVAIEGPILKDEDDGAGADPKKKKKKARKRQNRLRAMVFADLDILGDMLHKEAPAFVDQLVRDSVNWLGGQETFSGTIESEEDVPIKHTKKEDMVWFYSTIVGAPFFVLGFGFLSMFFRRRRSSRRSSKRSKS